MITVCYVVPGLGAGGAEKQLCELVANINRRHFKPVVVSLDHDVSSEWEAKLSAPVIGLPYRGRGDVAKVWRISRILAEQRPDLVHCFLTSGNFYGLLASLLARVSIRIAGERSIGSRLGRMRRIAYARILPLASAVVTNSQRNRDWLQSTYPRLAARVSVIHNGCSLPAGAAAVSLEERRRALGIRHGQFVVSSVTHLTPEKDVACLIRAATHLMRAGLDFKILVAGGGPLAGALRDMVGSNRLEDRVWLGGHLANIDALAIAQLSDAFVLTSQYEGMPNALMEAMALGRACVASSVGGVPELLDGVDSGLRFEAGDDGALARALLRLARDPAERTRLGENARARVTREFSIDQMVRRHEELYQGLLADRRQHQS